MRRVPDLQKPCPFCGQVSAEYSADDLHLAPYCILDHRYCIGKVIGSGGFGLTYIAYDLRFLQRVAVKELLPSGRMVRIANRLVLKDSSEKKQTEYQKIKLHFQRQTELLSCLRTVDGMVKILDYFEENGTSYQVLEYLEGEDLRRRLLASSRRMTIEETLQLMEPVMKTLEELHDRGVVHRDISADNLMILKNGTVKLIDPECDFGSSESAEERMVLGTVRNSYSPPEQVEGNEKQIGPWTDLYSLAACFYYCICGRLPKASGERANDQDLVRPSSYGVKITNRQEQVLMKALALSPKDRILSVREFREGLTYDQKNSKILFRTHFKIPFKTHFKIPFKIPFSYFFLITVFVITAIRIPSGISGTGQRKSTDADSPGESQYENSIQNPIENTIEESEDKEATDKESADKESADKESADKESADKESADKESIDKESTDKESTDKESTDKESTDKESTHKESIDKESTNKESAENQKESYAELSGDFYDHQEAVLFRPGNNIRQVLGIRENTKVSGAQAVLKEDSATEQNYFWLRKVSENQFCMEVLHSGKILYVDDQDGKSIRQERKENLRPEQGIYWSFYEEEGQWLIVNNQGNYLSIDSGNRVYASDQPENRWRMIPRRK